MLVATFLSLLLSSSVVPLTPTSRNSLSFNPKPTERNSRPIQPNFGQPSSKSTSRPNCPRIHVRKEVRQLDPTQRGKLFEAIKKLNSMPHPNTFDNFARQHNENSKIIHSSPVFLVWHRMFLKKFEQELQKIDPQVALAYWDWTKDSNAPEKSIIFTEDYFGSDGQGCVKSGRFAGWSVHYPKPHCLTRRWNKGSPGNDTAPAAGKPVMGKFVSRFIMDAIIDQSNTFDKFRVQIENLPHSYPHTWVGGDMTTMHSPNDPIFYFHHGFIDKIYFDWQNEDDSRHNLYVGRNKDGSSVTHDDPLSSLNARVREALNVRSLCYTYEDSLQRRDAPLTISTPAAPSLSTSPASNSSTAPGGSGKGAISSLMGMALDIVDSVLKKPAAGDKKEENKKEEEPEQVVEKMLKPKKKHHKSKYLNFNKEEAKCVADRLEEEIEVPEPIPECWINLNGYDLKTVRRMEASFKCLIRKINKQFRLRKASAGAPSDAPGEDASKNDSIIASTNSTSSSNATSAQTNNTTSLVAATLTANSSNGTLANGSNGTTGVSK